MTYETRKITLQKDKEENTYEKMIVLVLALMLALSLVACSGKDSSDSDKKNPAESGNSETVSDDDNNDSEDKSDDDKDDNKDDDKQAAPTAVELAGKIFLDLEEVQTDTASYSVNDIIMVPVQAIMEKIGYDVNWIAEEQKLEVWEPSRQHATVILTVGSTAAYYEKYAPELDERVSYDAVLDVAPILINDTLLAPLDFVVEAVGFTVDKTVDTADIYILSPEYVKNQEGEGIGEDQLNTDDELGEGIGQTQPLTEDEKSYVLSIRTESWLELSQDQKAEVVALMARWWDVVDGYIVEDFDSVLADLDHQMETYFRNSVDEGIMQTACDIYGLDVAKYVQ